MPGELELLLQRIVEFSERRAWRQFHTPRSLSLALASEVGELLGLIRWESDESLRSLDDEPLNKVRDEIADVGIFLLLLCDSMEVDLASAIQSKLDANAARFPEIDGTS